MDIQLLLQRVSDYVLTVDELYGHYLDTTSGFIRNEREMLRSQENPAATLPPGSDFDQLRYFYGNGHPNDPKSVILHVTTQGAFKARNAKGGANHVRAAQLLIVLLFEYWESKHRAHIAAALGHKHTNDLKVPLLGEIRLLRQDVIHHRGIVRHETQKELRLLSGFEGGQQIRLDGRQVESLVVQLKAALDSVAQQGGAPDPGHRMAWRFQ